MNKSKGITLIALVVTIVVLLILAGVSISMLTGDSGIITQSQNARTETLKGQYKEEINIIAIGEEMRYQTDEITFEEMVDEAEKKIKEKDYVITVTRNDSMLPDVILEAETDLNIVSVRFSEDEIEVAEGTIQPPEEADGNIFEYTTNEDGTINITGIDFSKVEHEIVSIEHPYYNAYQFVENEGILVKNMSTLNIPSTINGKTVVKVSFNVFTVVKGITKIVYPETAKYIGATYIFEDVEEIILQEGLEYIGEFGVKWHMKKLEPIVLPNSVKKVARLVARSYKDENGETIQFDQDWIWDTDIGEIGGYRRPE